MVEVFGGFHQDLLDFLYEARDSLEDKLSKEDYDHNPFISSTPPRPWLSATENAPQRSSSLSLIRIVLTPK